MFDGWVGYISTHDAIRLRWWCRNCNSRFYETYEFSRSGKKKSWGRYELKDRELHQLIDVQFAAIEIYNHMPGQNFNVTFFNPSHWASRFYNSVLNARS
ncbi:hypothetical protein niasHS_013906 [Heterodera schachtii]|uniref:Uncharacterized protein n=1 Tax=Heterodera schachtii TaxID=97005 RepID=A0ABD2IHK2_HETSC